MAKNKDYSYFVQREHKNTEKVNKRIANKSKEIEKILNEQKDTILARIDKFYQDFGDTYGVSEEQAKKLVSQFDVDTFKERAKKYVETKDTSYIANYDMRLYDTKQRISRLKLLLNEINLDLAEAYNKSALVMDDILTTNQANELKRQANLFSLPKNQIKVATGALMKESFTGTTFSSYWGKDLTQLYDILDVAIKAAVFNGQHPYKLKNRLNKEFDATDKWSKRLLLTETTRMQSLVQLASFKEAGFTRFLLVVESGACEKCASYSGKSYSIDEWMRIGAIPPIHPHCRCSLIPVDEKDEDEFIKMNRVENDKSDYKKYKDILGKNVPTFDKFQEMKYNKGSEWEELNNHYNDYQKWSKAKFPSKKSLKGHFESHSNEFPNMNESQYLELAQNLLSQPISENVLGYETEKGRRVRYDSKENLFAIASENKIRSLFKPKERDGYFYDDYKREYKE